MLFSRIYCVTNFPYAKIRRATGLHAFPLGPFRLNQIKLCANILKNRQEKVGIESVKRHCECIVTVRNLTREGYRDDRD